MRGARIIDIPLLAYQPTDSSVDKAVQYDDVDGIKLVNTVSNEIREVKVRLEVCEEWGRGMNPSGDEEEEY